METTKQELIKNISIEEDEMKGQILITPSSGDIDSTPTSGGNINNENIERKKKTRRGKPKGKNFKPYNKLSKEIKTKRLKKNYNSRLIYQPEAPNNSNQFLIEDHNFHHIPDLSPKNPNSNLLTHNPTTTSYRKCNRDSSFTSIDESDEDNFYSSPEDEEEFLTKEFSETYKNLHEESLNNMSKFDLIKQILSLEEKIENLTKKRKNKENTDGNEEQNQEILPADKIETLEVENLWLKREVERLNNENNILRRRCRSSSSSSIDSESDSSSSSSSSGTSTTNSKPGTPLPILVNGRAHDDLMEEDIESNNSTLNSQNNDNVQQTNSQILTNGSTAEKPMENV